MIGLRANERRATRRAARWPRAALWRQTVIRAAWALLAAMVLLVLAGGGTQAEAARVTGLSSTMQGADAIVTVDLDGPFEAPRLFYLDGPQRVVIDFPGVLVPSAQRAAGSGPVQAVRLAQNSPQLARLVIDLGANAVAALDPSVEPGRNALRVRVTGTDRNAFLAALRRGATRLAVASAAAPASTQVAASQPASAAATAPAPAPAPVQTAAVAPAPAPAPAPAAPVSPAALPVVVIDAGHGGQDPGAPSVIKGKWEKEVTLAIAKAIKAELDRSGKVKAVLTRSTDIFIPLGRRVEIAREAGANLFISIHADSIARPDVHGATVYTLSETASDKEAERLAAKENKADIIAGINLGAESPDVTNILIDLVQRETMNLSAEFAGIVVREVGKHRYFRSNNHRFAGFRVLKAPDVPSVLLETGYMSNEADSRYLFSQAGQAAIAKGVRAAVEAYFQRYMVQTAVAAGAS
ncbi:N-acetylmuramoyl-L-alanine amidase [Pedomonas sp. V897]|uniref:N-acetylmuramoyl-L-alanine amidase n=1 Tax=Pedomonas sp. V897 TaxID=3446482 RepID=UPI003EE3F399